MTGSIFFTSDTHFGHRAIMSLCDRPFGTVYEMDQVLVQNWNQKINPGDTVYHLGDFCFRNQRTASFYRNQLNGDIHLVSGNHDGHTIKNEPQLFASISEITEVKIEGQTIVLCHYPMREWHGSWRGAWHLFGHVHGRLDQDPLGYSLDVGVDSHAFQPLSFVEIKAVMAKRNNPFSGKRPKVTKGAKSGEDLIEAGNGNGR